MNVIGVGLGRTGTYSLRIAINQLGFGPCHHMDDVIQNMPAQVPLWADAVGGMPDWTTIYSGYRSAVDWPTACFYRELVAEFPDARFVLTHRSPESWADSFGMTILKLHSQRDEVPPEMREWLEMANTVVERSGFPVGIDRSGMIEAFVAHNEAVRALIPADRLLVFDVREGWEPLCDFLDVPVPDGPFPRSNSREEFSALVHGEAPQD